MKAFMLALAFLLLASPALGQRVDIVSSSDCMKIASPVAGQTLCFDPTANQLKAWNGSAWTSVVRVDVHTTAVLPAPGTFGRIASVTDGPRGIWIDTGSQWAHLGMRVVDVAQFATGGDGTIGKPWVGWETAIKWSGQTLYYFASGHFKLMSTLTLANARTLLLGAGKQASIIEFEPTAAGSAIKFQASSGVLYQSGIRGLGITSGETKLHKVAIELVDVSEQLVSDVAVGPIGRWTGATSVGLKIRGREMSTLSRIDLAADLPISIETNPASSISIDHFHFTDTYLIASGTNPCVKVATGVNLTNVTFDGANAWVLGGHGLQWVDTTSSLVSANLAIHNLRWEQSVHTSGYMVHIEHNSNLHNLVLENIYGGLNTNGVRLRRVVHASLKNLYYVGAATALDVERSVRPLALFNVFFQTGSTVRTTGLTPIFDSGQSTAGGTTSPFVLYDVLSAAAVVPMLGAGFRDPGVTLSSLGASPNGTIRYCTDCMITSRCAGEGTGALAKRLNGVWVCN